MHTRKPAKPFRSIALPSCFHRDLQNSFAERAGLSRFVQGPIASQEQGGSPSPPPTRKPARPFRSIALPSCFHRDLTNSFAERAGLSRFVQGPTASQEQGGSPSPTPTRKPGRPFRASAFHTDLCSIHLNIWAELAGLSCVLQTALQSAQGCHALCEYPPPQRIALSMPTRKTGRPFRSSALDSGVNSRFLIIYAEHRGLSRIVRGPTA